MIQQIKPNISIALLALILSACSNIKPIVKLAPEYQQPQVDIPTQLPRYDNQNSSDNINVASLGWHDFFADPRLHALIELALKNNTDLRTAALNVEQVRAQYAIARTAELPTLNGNSGISRSGNVRGSASNYSVGLGTATYELDLWGRVHNSSEAALQQFFATETTKDAVQLSLIASVAKAHFNELYAQANMNLAQRVLKSRQETYRLSKLKHQAGVISAVDLREQEAAIENAKTNYAAAVKSRDQARNALSLLISQPLPADLPQALPLDQQYKIQHPALFREEGARPRFPPLSDLPAPPGLIQLLGKAALEIPANACLFLPFAKHGAHRTRGRILTPELRVCSGRRSVRLHRPLCSARCSHPSDALRSLGPSWVRLLQSGTQPRHPPRFPGQPTASHVWPPWHTLECLCPRSK